VSVRACVNCVARRTHNDALFEVRTVEELAQRAGIRGDRKSGKGGDDRARFPVA
jgi:hypothetical protein